MELIYKSPLFAGMTTEEVDLVLERFGRIHRYQPEEVIALRGDRYQSLMIVVEGVVRGEMINQSGERIVIEEIEAPRAIAPAFLFATDNLLPVDVIAVKASSIVAIRIQEFTSLLQQNRSILHNYLNMMSDRSRFLSDRLRRLRFGTLRGKLSTYLFEQIQQSQSQEFRLPLTQQELADLFGVARPSVARVLGQLVSEGIIESKSGSVKVLLPNRLNELMNE